MFEALAADAVELAVWSIVIFAAFAWGVLLLIVGLRGVARSPTRSYRYGKLR